MHCAQDRSVFSFMADLPAVRNLQRAVPLTVASTQQKAAEYSRRRVQNLKKHALDRICKVVRKKGKKVVSKPFG